MNSTSSLGRRIAVYLIVIFLVLGSCFGIVGGSVGFDNWVSYLVLGIVAFLILALIAGNEIYIWLLRRKSKK